MNEIGSHFMKLLIMTLCVLGFASSVLAQLENAHWRFGFNAGIDFTSGAPVSVANSPMWANEGCSTISDAEGNLLFYTDGVTVYDANDMVMPNGAGLLGGASATQAALIVPDPADIHQYYIFTVGHANYPYQGFRYSKVNMTLNCGLGDVTEMNVQLMTPVQEKLNAIQNSDGTGYWVLVYGVDNSSYHAFPITTSGIGMPVSSVSGQVFLNNHAGAMRISPDGTWIANAMNQLYNLLVLARFDTGTGVVSDAFSVILPPSFSAFGLEFSSNSKLLYCGGFRSPGHTSGPVLFQLHLEPGDSSSVAASSLAIDSTSADNIGALSMGPDGKIYMTFDNRRHLGIVHSPDSLGMACDYEKVLFFLDHTARLGLQNHVAPLQPLTTSLQGSPQSPLEHSFFPNPTTDRTELVLDHGGQILNSMIIDGKGSRTPVTFSSKGVGSWILDLTGFNPGLYTTEIHLSDGTLLHLKVIKE